MDVTLLSDIVDEILRHLYGDYIASLVEYAELAAMRRVSRFWSARVDHLVRRVIKQLGTEVLARIPPVELVTFRQLRVLDCMQVAQLRDFHRLEHLSLRTTVRENLGLTTLRSLRALALNEECDLSASLPRLELLEVLSGQIGEPNNMTRLQILHVPRGTLRGLDFTHLTQLTELAVKPCREQFRDEQFRPLINLVRFTPPPGLTDAALVAMTRLCALDLRLNQSVTVGALMRLSHLTMLRVGSHPANELNPFGSALHHITTLRRLLVGSRGNIVEAKDLALCTQLEALSVHGSRANLWFGNAVLAEIGANLTWLAIDCPWQDLRTSRRFALNDAGLSALTNLRTLFVGSGSGDFSDASLSRLTNLCTLSLNYDGFTDAGLAPLTRLRCLLLFSHATGVTARGLDGLTRLRHCMVNESFKHDDILALWRRGVRVLPSAWRPDLDVWYPPGVTDSLVPGFVYQHYPNM